MFLWQVTRCVKYCLKGKTAAKISLQLKAITSWKSIYWLVFFFLVGGLFYLRTQSYYIVWKIVFFL